MRREWVWRNGRSLEEKKKKEEEEEEAEEEKEKEESRTVGGLALFGCGMRAAVSGMRRGGRSETMVKVAWYRVMCDGAALRIAVLNKIELGL